MAGLDQARPGHLSLPPAQTSPVVWMPGSRPGMTKRPAMYGVEASARRGETLVAAAQDKSGRVRFVVSAKA